VESGIQRALPDAQEIVGNLLDPLGNRPAVHRLQGYRLHNQQVECALQDVSLIAHVPLL
jgi:hypothetical protein